MTTMLDELDEVVGYELDSEVIGKDTRVLIKKTTDAPYRFICHLEVDGEWWGSGTLIGPRTVLTAGHCVSDESDNLIDTSRMRIIPGRNGPKRKPSSEPLGSTKPSAVSRMPGYVAGTRTDVGIVQLQTRIGGSVGTWTAEHSQRKGDPYGTSILRGPLPMPAGQLKVNLCGYPGDKPSGGTSETLGTFQYLAYDETVTRKDGLLIYNNDTYHGHSGSPVWVRRHASMGGRVMAGIHIRGYGARTNAAVFIDDVVRRFIIANTLK